MPDEFELLLEALRKLKAAGELGFEGLIRDLLESISGRAFRLVKSGPQAGKDIVADKDRLLPALAVEAKRFDAMTDLPADELRAKLHDALASPSGLDLWAAALTREMKQPDWSDLEEIAAKAGVDIIALDWREAPGSLPVLAALCGGGRHIIEQRIGAGLSGILDRITQHADFAKIIGRLRRQLTGSDAGFDIARDTANAWLLESVTSVAQAQSRLGGHVDILANDAHLIARPEIERRISTWWQTGSQNPLALLGQEGRGKSWVALRWCIELAKQNDAPMILAASAKHVSTGDAETVLAALLARSMPLVDKTHLARRVARWTQAAPARIILLIDGLNEAWTSDWTNFVRLFDVEPWKGRVSVLLTSRTGYWHEYLGHLHGAVADPIAEVDVPEFTQPELDSYLATYNLKAADLPPGLLGLIKIPRFARLALSLRDKWHETEDLTVGRLILEDWRSRLAQRGNALRLDDAGLIAFVADLGRAVRDDSNFRISTKQIHEQLSSESGLDRAHYQQTINELIEGSWLTATDKPHSYKVNERLLPYAIGLDLARGVQALTEKAAIDDVIAKFQEQLRGADIGVDILRAATSVSFLSGAATVEAREALLKSWLGSQNFRAVDFVELWPLVSRDPELFLRVAEAFWKDNPISRGAAEILAKAFVNASKWPQVMDRLVSLTPRWVGGLGLDPVNWGLSRNIPIDAERQQKTEKNLAEWKAIEQAYSRKISKHFRIDEDDYLPDAALAIISHLRRKTFIETIVTWAVTRAIMEYPLDEKSFDWMLRLNIDDHDEFEEALLDECRQLHGLQSAVATRAADLLLEALSTGRGLKARSGTSAPSPSWQGAPGWPGLNKENLLVWKQGHPPDDFSDLAWLSRLGPFAAIPDVKLDPADQAKVNAIAADIEAQPDMLDPFDPQRTNDIIALARWSPKSLGLLIRNHYSALSGSSDKTISRARYHIEEALFLLAETQKDSLLALGLQKIASETLDQEESKKKNSERASHSLVVAGLIGKPATIQLETLVRLLPSFHFSVALAEFLTRPELADIEFVLARIGAASDVHEISSWIGYLNAIAHTPYPANAAQVLLPLTASDNKDIRGAAIQLILNSRDPVLGKAFVDSGWSHQKGQEGTEALCGTYLIVQCGGHFAFSEARKRIVPQALSQLVERRGLKEDEVRAAFAFIDELLDEKINNRRKPRYGYMHVFEAPQAWRKIAELDIGALIKKTRQAADAGHLHGYFNIIPLVELMTAILDIAPQEGADILDAIKKTHRNLGMGHGDLDSLTYTMTEGDALSKARQEMLNAAKNDDALADAAYQCLKNGHEDWLIDFIHRELEESNAGRVARGLTLAGFLDDTERAQKLWSEINKLALGEWLNEVRSTARSSYEHNIHARYWFEQFYQSANKDEAFSRLKLFHECMDQRSHLWGHSMTKQFQDKVAPDWLSHLEVTAGARRERKKNVAEERKKTLFFNAISHNVWPWL